MLSQLAYISLSELDDLSSEIDTILDGSRQRNAQRGITGVLLYAQGMFFQLLEGEELEIKSLYKKIANDPRHSDVTILMEAETTDRQFKQWEMGWYRVPDSHPYAAQIKSLGDPVNRGGAGGQDTAVQALIDSFFELHRA
ncbi:MAG: BLUF domain-containing protein [Pseudomonadota bacterium]